MEAVAEHDCPFGNTICTEKKLVIGSRQAHVRATIGMPVPAGTTAARNTSEDVLRTDGEVWGECETITHIGADNEEDKQSLSQ